MKLLLLFLSIVFSVPLQAKPEFFGEQLIAAVDCENDLVDVESALLCLENSQGHQFDPEKYDSFSESQFPVKVIDVFWLNNNGELVEKNRPMAVRSDSSDSLTFMLRYPDTDSLTLQSKQIISWDRHSSQDSNFSGKINAVVAGALVFPPGMLLGLLPSGKVDVYTHSINYIDRLGSPKRVFIQSFCDNGTAIMGYRGCRGDDLNKLLYSITSLVSGQQRTSEEINARIGEARSYLKKVISLLSDELMDRDPGKPWCERINPANNPRAYNQYVSAVNALASISAASENKPNSSHDLNRAWEDHLSANPNLKVWADANPTAAQKFRQCS